MGDVTAAEVKNLTLEQKPILGIVLFVVATFFIIVMIGFVKAASEYHDPIEAVFYRGVVAMSLLLIYAFSRKKFSIFRTQRLKSHLGRSVAGNIGVAFSFWSYSLMPMADVTALLFSSSLIATLLSGFMLKETVGLYRWLAVVMGFIGVLFIIQPTGSSYDTQALLVVLMAASSGALVHIFLRDLGSTEDALTTVFYFLLFGILFTGIYMIFKGSLPHEAAVIPLLGAGVAGGAQLILKTHAFRIAEASLLSPFSYTSILWATLFGWMFWGELPTTFVVIGTFMIISSNLFIIWRERSK